ncbi:MAG: hypothetical protein V3S48_07510, partial [Candidatus Neomarinimicrobiota bacterium]
LSKPRLPIISAPYIPSLTEWALFAGGISVFCFLFLLFSKVFPLISIWEIKEGRSTGLDEAKERLDSYLPDTGSEMEGETN